MITIITGVPRAGKSYKAVHDGLHRLAEGVPQFVNFRHDMVNVERFLRLRKGFTTKQILKTFKLIHEVHNYEDMFNMFGQVACDLTIDEAGDWFPAREHSVLPIEFLQYWRQHGKVGINATLISQTLSALDAQIRGLAAEIYVARPAPLSIKLLYALRTLDPKRKIIHYTLTFDQSDDRAQTTAQPKASFRRHTLVLDYLEACCYTSKQTFPSPFSALKAVKNPAHAANLESLGIRWREAVLTKQHRDNLAFDGLPVLSLYDVQGLSSVELADLLQRRIKAEIDFIDNSCGVVAPADGVAEAGGTTPHEAESKSVVLH